MGNHQNSVIFIIGVIAVLLGSVETPGRSQNSSQAVTNFGPLPVLIKLAEQGDAKAQHRLGLIYFLGQGVPKDDAEGLKWFRKAADQGLADAQAMLGAYYREHKEWAEAIKWFRKAADQGDKEAQFSVGMTYAYGDGVDQNYTEAVAWLRKAADQGYERAEYNLGFIYYRGGCWTGICHDQGVPQDYAEAAKWFRKAGDQGDEEAQFNLAVMYNDGQGVPQDYVQAHMWANLAGAANHKDAAKLRDQVAAKMTPQQIAEAQKLAREWKPTKK